MKKKIKEELRNIPTMSLICTTGDAFFSRVIRWWTRGKSSHTAIYIGSGRHKIAESLWRGNQITRLEKYLKKGCRVWIYAKPGLTLEQEALMKTFIYTTKDRKYDWRGLFKFVFRKIPQDPDRNYCSEWSIETFNAGNVFIPNGLSPGELQDYVIDKQWTWVMQFEDGKIVKEI